MVRGIASLPLAVAALLLGAVPEVAQESAGAFPGIWEARLRGARFAVLRIEDRGKIWGTMVQGHVETGKGGNLIEGAADSEAQAIQRARIVDSRLLFELPDRGAHGDSALEFSLEVTGPDRALLRILNPPPNIKIKPLRFTRRSDSAMNNQRFASQAR